MLTLTWILLACQPKAPPASATPTVVIDVEPAADERMRGHFGLASTAQQAVVDGDLRATRDAAAALASVPMPEGFDPMWKPDFDALQARASAAAAARTLPEAGAAVASLGAACGACHAREGVGPKAPMDELGKTYDLPRDSMPRHQWATTWLWLGLVGPDEAAYDAGLALLAEPPTWDPRSDAPAYAALQMRLVDLSKTAVADRSTEARTRVYGEVLGTCAGCHQRYRKTP